MKSQHYTDPEIEQRHYKKNKIIDWCRWRTQAQTFLKKILANQIQQVSSQGCKAGLIYVNQPMHYIRSTERWQKSHDHVNRCPKQSTRSNIHVW